MKIIKPTTYPIDVKRRQLNELRKLLPTFIKGRLFDRPTPKQIADFIKEISYAESDLWNEVKRTYPEMPNNAEVSYEKVQWDELPQ